MRVRKGLLAVAVASLVATGISTAISTPVQAAASGWTYIGEYRTKSLCVDMGQQYQREGWNGYTCRVTPEGKYNLWVQ
jgi:hypothetical protein